MDTARTPENTPPALVPQLNAGSGLVGLAIASVITRARAAGRRPLIRGLAEESFAQLAQTFFVDCQLRNGSPADAVAPPPEDECDEFDELVALLLANRAEASEELRWLSFAMASAAMGEGHLWQDMGLASRDVLSQLIAESYPALHSANSANMKWKKFFYRQLCAAADVPICKSPHCADCCDYPICFGPEH